jgi:glycine/D-amino acid oxidase-like deaminating enzyme
MKAVYADCLRLGIRFVTGPSGTMGNLIQGEDGEVLGVEAEDGTRHLADRVILACGGWMDSVIDTKGQCLAKAYVSSQLTI